MSLFIYHTVG